MPLRAVVDPIKPRGHLALSVLSTHRGPRHEKAGFRNCKQQGVTRGQDRSGKER